MSEPFVSLSPPFEPPQPAAAIAHAQERESNKAIKYFFIKTPYIMFTTLLFTQGKLFAALSFAHNAPNQSIPSYIILYIAKNDKKKRGILRNFLHFS